MSPTPPPPPSSEAEKQPVPEPHTLNQAPILPPTDAPTAISESTSTPPPAQSVTVVVSPTPQQQEGSAWRKWTSLGAILGVAIGLAAAGYYHSKLPGEFESTARVQVTGPAAAADAATQIAILNSKSVLSTAAAKLDNYRPFQMPPDADEGKRAAFLEKGLIITPAVTAEAGSTFHVTFRGPHPADSPKYLMAIVDAYKSDLSNRPAGAVPAPRPAARPTPDATPTGPDPAGLERAKLEQELAALTKDEPAAIEKRIADARAAVDAEQARLKKLDRELAVIRGAGTSRKDRLATMDELGIKYERPEVPSSVLADAKVAEDNLRALQLKKAELGQRLGAEHRDMLALDQQMDLMKERIAKAAPATPVGPDELEKHRQALESERGQIVARTAIPAAIVAGNEKLLEQVLAIRKQIDALPAPRNAVAATPKQEPLPVKAEPPVSYSVQAVVSTQDGTRVSPPWSRSLVPGGAIGLISGALLGLLYGLLFTGTKPAPRKVMKPYRPMVSPVIRASSPSVPITSGPKLGVQVFANVPAITDAPVEKRSVGGWSPLLVAFSRPSSVEAEVFRMARRELTSALHSRGHQVIPITSPGVGDGKSFVAANLALSLAQAGKRVVLVDCDLRRAKQQELFRLTRLGDSLKSLMSSDVDLRMAVRSCEVPNLFLLPAGRGVSDPQELLSRPKFRELLAELKSSYEYVILDAPATEDTEAFAALASAADGVVMVVRNNSDAPARSDRARNQVIASGSRVLGAIVNAAPAPSTPPAQESPKALAMA
jgi:capsular exopolysaccharide synthesis family protein